VRTLHSQNSWSKLTFVNWLKGARLSFPSRLFVCLGLIREIFLAVKVLGSQRTKFGLKLLLLVSQILMGIVDLQYSWKVTPRAVTHHRLQFFQVV